MSWNDLTERYQKYFINMLHETASMSKDKNTKVGALIIDTINKVPVSSGWNDLARGVLHTDDRNSRPLKYIYTSHAEQSSLSNALRLRADVVGKTLLVTLGACPQCCNSIVNSGIVEIVTPTLDFNHISCGELYEHSVAIVGESGVKWIYDDRLAYANN